MKLEEIFNTVTANESREMTFKLFKQAAGEVLIDYTKYINDMGRLKTKCISDKKIEEMIVKWYLKSIETTKN